MSERTAEDIADELVDKPSETQDTVRPSIVRTRIIPGIAAALFLALIGVIVVAVVAPDAVNRDQRRAEGRAIVFEEPKMAQDFTLEPIKGGEAMSLADFRGKTVVINFWASWCGPCKREIPILTQAARQVDEDVVIVGIDTLDQKDDALKMMDDFAVNYLVLNDNNSGGDSVAVDYGLVGVPETYLINSEGELVALQRGEFQSVREFMDLVALAK